MEITKERLEADEFGKLLKLVITGVMDKLPETAEVVAIRLQIAYTCPEFEGGEVVAVGQTRSTTKYNPVDISQMFIDYARKQHAALEQEFGAKHDGSLVTRGPRRRPRRTPT